MRSVLTKLRKDVRGNILIMGAACMPVFIGAAGLATDTILWALWAREIQRSADSAAIAGALTVQQARYKAEKAAIHDFKKSKAFQVHKAQMWFENAPHSGPWKKDKEAVLVRVRLKTSLPFSNFFLKKPVFIEAEAVATLAKGMENCVIALDGNAAAAVDFGGNSTVDLKCSVASNSGSPTAVAAGGSSSISAPFVHAVGGISGGGQYGSTELQPFSPPQIDPFRDLPRPRAPAHCNPKVVVKPTDPKTVLSPGCYAGLDLKGLTELQPGIYHITGNIEIHSGANVTGAGVTLILTRNKLSDSVPQMLVNGSPMLDLSAPSSGDYQDVLIYQDPDAVYQANKQNTFSGNSTSRLAGGIYFPNQPLQFTGNSGMDLGCFKMVARTVAFTGSSYFSNDCPEKDDRFQTTRVRLVS